MMQYDAVFSHHTIDTDWSFCTFATVCGQETISLHGRGLQPAFFQLWLGRKETHVNHVMTSWAIYGNILDPFHHCSKHTRVRCFKLLACCRPMLLFSLSFCHHSHSSVSCVGIDFACSAVKMLSLCFERGTSARRLHDSQSMIVIQSATQYYQYPATLPLIKARQSFSQPSQPELTAVHRVLQDGQRLGQEWPSGTWWVPWQEQEMRVTK